MSKQQQLEAAPPLKRWTKKNLRESDYAFARSENGGDCLATRLWKNPNRAAKHLVAEMIDWELLRELKLPDCAECKRKPYLDIPEHQARIKSMPSRPPAPSTFPPLEEIPLANVPAWLQAREGMDDGTTLHAFEIQRYDNTDDTITRFRNWLVSFKQTPDRLQWRADLKKSFANRGALEFDATLRALAVRRLKLAGYYREEAEKLLGLKRYALADPTDQWTKWPTLAETKVQDLFKALSVIYQPAA